MGLLQTFTDYDCQVIWCVNKLVLIGCWRISRSHDINYQQLPRRWCSHVIWFCSFSADLHRDFMHAKLLRSPHVNQGLMLLQGWSWESILCRSDFVLRVLALQTSWHMADVCSGTLGIICLILGQKMKTTYLFTLRRFLADWNVLCCRNWPSPYSKLDFSEFKHMWSSFINPE